jgi:steroid 5-alpha reductase family enzyme
MIEHGLILLATTFITMTVGFIISKLIGNTSVIDVFWGLGFGVVAVVFWVLFPTSDGHKIMLALMIAWSLRLALFLGITRTAKKKQDERYTELEKKWGFSGFKTLLHFYLQASLLTPIAAVILPAFQTNVVPITLLQVTTATVFILALIGQWLADYQLYSFKKSGNTGVCNVGLWSISRHPNYFFEFVMWTSLAVYSIGLPNAGWAWISPITIWVITRYMTGPYTERLSLKKRPVEYDHYQRSVSFIIPWIDSKTPKQS